MKDARVLQPLWCCIRGHGLTPQGFIV